MASFGRVLAGMVLFCALAVGVFASPATGAPRPAALPDPSAQTTVVSIPRVGALFFPSVLGSSLVLGLPHECSGSVVHSPLHNLVLTAAHCITGNGLGYDFAPGYHDRIAPYGVWSAQRVYVNAAWTAHRDPQHDYAFLVMAPRRILGVLRNIEDVTGAYTLGVAPASGTAVTVDGYVAGVGDRPISCTSTVYYTAGFPSFDCDGFAGGTSGGPWLHGASVVGVIGGLHQGGCVESTSYSAAFGADIAADLQRAATHAVWSFVPFAGSAGCPAA